MDKILTLLDRIFVATLLAWFLLDLLGTPLEMLLVIALLGIATIFFLQAYRPTDLGKESDKEDKSGFEVLLAMSIVPKVLGISSSVGTIGILFYSFEMEGFLVMLTVGSISIAVAFFILLILGIRGMNLRPILPRVIKSAIVLLFTVLIQFNI